MKLLILFVVFIIGVQGKRLKNDEFRSFRVDYTNNTFLMDDKPFRYVAGSFHYFRTLPTRWRPIFKTMRAGGLNAVDIYVHWALHNPHDGVYNWQGIADLEDVIKAAEEEDLYVILRPGPYICAELDMGGLPYWLYTKYPNIQVRTKDVNYLIEVQIWWKELMGRMQKHMYGNGGPIIMVQVENEYGAYGKCDEVYKKWLKMETEKYTERQAVLFTVDRPDEKELGCGFIEGVLATVDFGLATDEQVDKHWIELRKFQPNGPLVNSEFYSGWFTHWFEPSHRVEAAPLATTLIKMLSDGASVNFYMYFGGTNFGFTAGANAEGVGEYRSDTTSYDYDAVLDEGGNPTEKFHLFKSVIQAFYPNVVFPNPPAQRKIVVLNDIWLNPKATLMDPSTLSSLNTRTTKWEKTPSFEQLSQDSGFVLYETTLPKFTRDPSWLRVNGLRDRAFIFVGGKFIGTLAREGAVDSLPLNAGWSSKLQILVENLGRVNWMYNSDFKGIMGDVELQMWNKPSVVLKDWTVTGIPLDDYSLIENVAFSTSFVDLNSDGFLSNGPVIFSAAFAGPITENYDMYLDMEKWGKGIVFINGMNLGRYWPLAGPQITSYVPGELIKDTDNRIVIIEYQRYNTDSYKVSFSQEAKLDG